VSDSVRIAVGRTMAAIAIGSSVIGVAWLIALGETYPLLHDWTLQLAMVSVGFGVIAWLVVPGEPRNGAVWLLGWTAVFTGLAVLAESIGYQYLVANSITTPLFEMAPADVPLPIGIVMMNLNWLWMPLFLPFTVGLLLFPDGRAEGRGWRVVASLTGAFIAITIAGLMLGARPSSTVPLVATQNTDGGLGTPSGVLTTVGYVGTFAMIPLCVAGMIAHFRRSSGTRRQQFRWVVWGATVAGLFLLAAFVSDELLGRLDPALLLGGVGMSTLVAAYGIAITRYRLYSVDTVISRSFVFGSLALFITGAYVAVVVGVGSLLGIDETSPVLEIVATSLVAIAFQPIRRRLQRIANRIAFGRRATPYQVLSDFSRRVVATDETTLTAIARSLVEGTSGSHAAVWIGEPGARRAAARWPDHDVDEFTVERPIIHGGTQLGSATLTAAKGTRLGPADEQLLQEVASGLGLVLHNLQLTDALRMRVSELRASRRRIVAVRDETRRSLERNLHDGAQQQLVAIKVKLGLARQLAMRGEAGETAALLETVSARTDDAIEMMRDFARGIYPPLLEAEGLVPALSAQVRKLGIPVKLTNNGFGRYDSHVESTLYFCAVDLISRSAGNDVEIRLAGRQTSAGFELTRRAADTAWDADALADLGDRIDAAGGTMVITQGTGLSTVEVDVPLVAA